MTLRENRPDEQTENLRPSGCAATSSGGVRLSLTHEAARASLGICLPAPRTRSTTDKAFVHIARTRPQRTSLMHTTDFHMRARDSVGSSLTSVQIQLTAQSTRPLAMHIFGWPLRSSLCCG